MTSTQNFSLYLWRGWKTVSTSSKCSHGHENELYDHFRHDHKELRTYYSSQRVQRWPSYVLIQFLLQISIYLIKINTSSFNQLSPLSVRRSVAVHWLRSNSATGLVGVRPPESPVEIRSHISSVNSGIDILINKFWIEKLLQIFKLYFFFFSNLKVISHLRFNSNGSETASIIEVSCDSSSLSVSSASLLSPAQRVTKERCL